MSEGSAPTEAGLRIHAGWIAGALVIVGVLVVGGVFWYLHHP